MNMKHDLEHGFTLIELLVVISIIGTLSTIALTSLNGARAKARDARRYSDMNEIKMALELYFADHGSYPATGGSLVCAGLSSSESCWGGVPGSTSVKNALAPYIGTIPTDPSGTGGGRIYSAYAYRSPGKFAPQKADGSLDTAQTGSYSLAFMPDKVAGSPSCGGWTFGAWDMTPPANIHCPEGGSCRQCGYLKE